MQNTVENDPASQSMSEEAEEIEINDTEEGGRGVGLSFTLAFGSRKG